MATDAGATDSSLEHELDRMLEIEKFEPPAEFRERAQLVGPGDLRGGGRRPGRLVDGPLEGAARLGRRADRTA